MTEAQPEWLFPKTPHIHTLPPFPTSHIFDIGKCSEPLSLYSYYSASQGHSRLLKSVKFITRIAASNSSLRYQDSSLHGNLHMYSSIIGNPDFTHLASMFLQWGGSKNQERLTELFLSTFNSFSHAGRNLVKLKQRLASLKI